MPWLVLAAAALALAGGAWFASRRQVSVGQGGAQAAASDVVVSAVTETVAPTLDSIYQKYGAQFGVDWRLLKADAQHESGENPSAVNEADNESIGLMQILCRPDGTGGCANKLNVDGWSDATREKLLDPDFNVYIGAQIMAANIKAYGVLKGIAVYNAWDQHTAPAAGPFKNQAYVVDVLRRAAKLGWSP